MKLAKRILGTLLVLLAATAASAQLIDTFEDGTTMGWHVGDPTHPAPPANIATGGPGGADDNFLMLTAVGGAAVGSRLAVLSGPQWVGNYSAAGITSIRMDVRNFGPDDLYLRLLLEDFAGIGPPVNLALSKDPVFLVAGTDWQTVTFSVALPDLVPGIFGGVAGALASVDTLRIFHNPAAEFPGPGIGVAPVTVQLGVDNLTPVPEPGTLLAGFVVLGIVATAAMRRRTRVAA